MYGAKTRVSLFQLFCHEIFSEARKRIAEDLETLEARNSLSDALDTQKKALTAGASLTIIAALLAKGLVEGELVVVRTAIGSVEFPALYLIFFGCIGWFIFIISCLQAAVLILAQARLDQSPLFSAGRPSAYAVLTGGRNYDFLSPIRPGNFFSIKGANAFGALICFPFFILLLPIFGSISATLRILLIAISTSDSVFLGIGFEIASLCLVLLPVFFSILYFIPFPIKKEIGFIRWTYLLRVTRASSIHHNSMRWLNEEKR